jgi:hypothetical protein
LILFGLLALPACEKPAQEPAPAPADPMQVVLARVGDEVVTVEDLGFVPARTKTADRLEMLVTRKLAAAEARRRGLADDPKTRAKLAEFRRNLATWEESLLRNALYNSIRQGMTLDEEAVRAHFEKTKHRYLEGQSTLRLQTFAGEAEARAAAKALGAEGRLDPAASESLGPAAMEQLPDDLRPVVRELAQPGDRRVVDRAGVWTLVELEAYEPNAPLPFETVRAKVEQDLRAVLAEEAMNAELAKLRAEQVRIEDAALAEFEQDRQAQMAKLRAERAAAAAPPAEPAAEGPTAAP